MTPECKEHIWSEGGYCVVCRIGRPKTMTAKAQRIACAELCGWCWYRRSATGIWANKPMRSLYHPELIKSEEKPLELADMTERECNPAFIWREGLVPDFPSDWNTRPEMLRVIEEHGLEAKFMQIIGEVSGFHYSWKWLLITQPQFVECFLRATGQWEETK